ncbi:hypothetical protein GCM10008967_27760 [Bacillus carboniphilus]|uniref:Uncharacterized protein n=1 Tax=Bacillus carboniphilus TaxID=86663 RepID=A0ABP3G4D8_9BACI
MGAALNMRIDSNSALNFLIYIQNIYLNHGQIEHMKLKFPYFSSRVAFNREFVNKYKELWNEFSQRVSKDSRNGVDIFYEEKEILFHSLFENSPESLKHFNEIYKSFDVWWYCLLQNKSAELCKGKMQRPALILLGT